jgi:hypothetical protein
MPGDTFSTRPASHGDLRGYPRGINEASYVFPAQRLRRSSRWSVFCDSRRRTQLVAAATSSTSDGSHATEIALLVLARSAVAGGLPFGAILSLPILFAAGMSLLDTMTARS